MAFSSSSVRVCYITCNIHIVKFIGWSVIFYRMTFSAKEFSANSRNLIRGNRVYFSKFTNEISKKTLSWSEGGPSYSVVLDVHLSLK